MYRTDDPLADFDRHEAEMEEQAKRLPICSNCGERIMSEHLLEIGGEMVCEDCIDEYVGKHMIPTYMRMN